MTVPGKKTTAKYAPAAAILRREIAMIGITGRKEHRRDYTSKKRKQEAKVKGKARSEEQGIGEEYIS